MYLSKAYLNTENSQVIHDLGDIYDFHRTISRLFPNITSGRTFREEFQVLYRIDIDPETQLPYLLIQSKITPRWQKLIKNNSNYFKDSPKSIKLIPIFSKLRAKQVCVFRLKANPVKRPPPKKYGKGEYRGKTNRIPIQKEDELIKWIERKGKDAGFRLIQLKTANENKVYDLNIKKIPKSQFKTPFRYKKVIGTKKHQTITFHSVIYEGHLQIIKIKEFKEALINGIGPSKAFGFGLLSIYPIGT